MEVNPVYFELSEALRSSQTTAEPTVVWKTLNKDLGDPMRPFIWLILCSAFDDIESNTYQDGRTTTLEQLLDQVTWLWLVNWITREIGQQRRASFHLEIQQVLRDSLNKSPDKIAAATTANNIFAAWRYCKKTGFPTEKYARLVHQVQTPRHSDSTYHFGSLQDLFKLHCDHRAILPFRHSVEGWPGTDSSLPAELRYCIFRITIPGYQAQALLEFYRLLNTYRCGWFFATVDLWLAMCPETLDTQLHSPVHYRVRTNTKHALYVAETPPAQTSSTGWGDVYDHDAVIQIVDIIEREGARLESNQKLRAFGFPANRPQLDQTGQDIESRIAAEVTRRMAPILQQQHRRDLDQQTRNVDLDNMRLHWMNHALNARISEGIFKRLIQRRNATAYARQMVAHGSNVSEDIKVVGRYDDYIDAFSTMYNIRPEILQVLYPDLVETHPSGWLAVYEPLASDRNYILATINAFGWLQATLLGNDGRMGAKRKFLRPFCQYSKFRFPNDLQKIVRPIVAKEQSRLRANNRLSEQLPLDIHKITDDAFESVHEFLGLLQSNLDHRQKTVEALRSEHGGWDITKAANHLVTTEAFTQTFALTLRQKSRMRLQVLTYEAIFKDWNKDVNSVIGPSSHEWRQITQSS